MISPEVQIEPSEFERSGGVRIFRAHAHAEHIGQNLFTREAKRPRLKPNLGQNLLLCQRKLATTAQNQCVGIHHTTEQRVSKLLNFDPTTRDRRIQCRPVDHLDSTTTLKPTTLIPWISRITGRKLTKPGSHNQS